MKMMSLLIFLGGLAVAAARAYSCSHDRPEIYKKQLLCGKDMEEVLSCYCRIFPDKITRRRRSTSIVNTDNHQIVQLCCENECTIKSLLDSYCDDVFSEFQHLFNELPKTNAISSGKRSRAADEYSSSQEQDLAVSAKRVVSKEKQPLRRNHRKTNKASNKKRRTRQQNIKSSSSPSHTYNHTSTVRKTPKRCRCSNRRKKDNFAPKIPKKRTTIKPYPKAEIGYIQTTEQRFAQPGQHSPSIYSSDDIARLSDIYQDSSLE